MEHDDNNLDTSTGQAPDQSTGNFTDKRCDHERGMNINIINVNGRIPFHKLLSFANLLDSVLMLVGTIAATGNGLCVPFVALLFGDLMDSIGQNATKTLAIHGVLKVYIDTKCTWCDIQVTN